MLNRIKNIEMFLDKIMRVTPDQKFLIITDTYARPMALGQVIMNLACDRNIETVWSVMKPRTHQGHEPPEAIATAMKTADVIFEIVDKFDCTHTTARQEASEAGAKYFLTSTGISEDYIIKKISFKDLEVIRDRTNKLAERLTQATIARVTTPLGTDISMDIEGRPGLPLHPLRDAVVSMIPDYAEAAISPNEGTSEGVIVVDGSVQEWGYVLREPLTITVKKGRIQRVQGDPKDVNGSG